MLSHVHPGVAILLAAVCGGLITVDGNHMIAYTHPDVVATQIRQAATSAVR